MRAGLELGDTILGKQPRKDHHLKTSDTLRALAYFSQIGITMAASVLIGVLLGRYLDICWHILAGASLFIIARSCQC